MLNIKQLDKNQYKDAINIKHRCIREDYINIVTSEIIKSLDPVKELGILSEWMSNQGEDIRIMYGAINNNKLVGFIGASLAEKNDSDNGVEVNYLFVDRNNRGKGLGAKLLYSALSQYLSMNVKNVIIYNFRETNSNKYYKRLEGKVLRTDMQMWCGSNLMVDVFMWDIDTLVSNLEKRLNYVLNKS